VATRVLSILLLALSAQAGSYWVVTDTNMVPALGSNVALRSFIEPQFFTTSRTNWVEAGIVRSNGTNRVHQIRLVTTTKVIMFDYEGETHSKTVSVDSRAIEDRFIDVPTPQVPVALPRRNSK
jgi:hypothetical protein